MERRQLEYFVAIVEHGGFTHAARALRVAQPSLSRAIGKLEHELGVTLFHRVGRNAVLSNAGELVVERARLVLRDLDALRAAARTVGSGAAGRVDVAATSSSALEPVISIIAELRERHPGVLVSTSSALSATEVVAMVLQGRCEVGVCGHAERPAGQGLVAHHLRDEEFLLVAPPGTRKSLSLGPPAHESPFRAAPGNAMDDSRVAMKMSSGRAGGSVGRARGSAGQGRNPGLEQGGVPVLKQGGDPALEQGGDLVLKQGGGPALKQSGDPALKQSEAPGLSGEVTRDDLRGMRFVVTKPVTAARALFDRISESVGGLFVAAEVGDRSVVLPMVLRGIGASLMPDGWRDLAVRAGAEVYHFTPRERIPQWLVHRSGPITPATQAFLDTVNAWSAVGIR